jgi:hypothetical protein
MSADNERPRRGWARIAELGPVWISAIAALIVALATAGFFTGRATAPTVTTAAPPTTTITSADIATPTRSTLASTVSATKSWNDVQAVITANDGTVTRMPAGTLRFCFSGGLGVNLNDSQDIAFDKMTRIDVVRSDVALSPGGKATLHITLASGSTIDGTITSGCDFFGQSELGRYSLYPDKLSRIEFPR